LLSKKNTGFLDDVACGQFCHQCGAFFVLKLFEEFFWIQVVAKCQSIGSGKTVQKEQFKK